MMAKGNYGTKSAGETGFSFRGSNGKTNTVVRTAAGVTLVNGQKTERSYDKLLAAAQKSPSFTTLSDSDIKRARSDRAAELQSHDYELRGGRGKGKTVYRPGRQKW